MRSHTNMCNFQSRPYYQGIQKQFQMSILACASRDQKKTNIISARPQTNGFTNSICIKMGVLEAQSLVFTVGLFCCSNIGTLIVNHAHAKHSARGPTSLQRKKGNQRLTAQLRHAGTLAPHMLHHAAKKNPQNPSTQDALDQRLHALCGLC